MTRLLSLETMALAATGALIGLLATPFLLARVGEMVPQWIAIPDSAARVPVLKGVLDPAVAAVAFGSAVLGALVLTGPGLASAIGRSGPTRSGRVHAGMRGTRMLVAVEVALATVLCVGAGLVVRSAENLLAVDVGMEHEKVLTLYFGDVWGIAPPDRVPYFRQAVEAVEALPGVTRAGVIGYVDFLAEDDYARVYFLDRSFQPLRSTREEWRRVDEGLFESVGLRIVEGRGFEADDFVGTVRSAVVNEAFAAKHWPGSSPIGAYLSTHNEGYRDMQIVGVVADVHSLGPAVAPPAMLYVPYQADPRGTQGMYVRVEGDPMSYLPAVREAIWSVDSSEPVMPMGPLSSLVESWVAVPKATRALVSSLALLALLLSAVGVFGVVSYAVRTRRSELGVRLALGATPDRLELDQMRTMIPVVALGVAVGLAGGVLAARTARQLLYGVSPLDPTSLGLAFLAMSGAAMLAAWLPARRVSRIDPTEAIRVE